MASNHEADVDVSQPDLINEKMASLEVEGSDAEDAASQIRILALDMQQRCRALLEELQHFHDYLKQQKREKAVESKLFGNRLKSEMKVIDRLAAADPSSPKTVLGVNSANLAYYSSVWSYAKTCKSVIGLGKRFYWVPGQDKSFINGKVNTKGVKHKSNNVLVDIVAKNGLEWIKVSSSTEQRIIWDLAKSGWVGSDSDDSDYENENESSDDEDGPQGLLKLAEALMKASQATRVRYRRPTVRLVLPKISSKPQSKEVATILQQIRNLGVIVQTSDEMPAATLPITEAIPTMAEVRYEPFTDTINVDCTILLAFVSDLSHGRVEPADWHNRTLAKQIETEVTELLLPTSLWPTCGSRKLVCTKEAALRMREIVDIIGTVTEKTRTSLLFDTTLAKSELMSQFQEHSSYPIPPSWSLPIRIVDDDQATILSSLPSIAPKVLEQLTPINKSVFGYGWASGLTTISSNGIVAKQIEWAIEEHREGEETGPDVWLSAASRSLVGKEKERRGASEKSDTAEKVRNFSEKWGEGKRLTPGGDIRGVAGGKGADSNGKRDRG